MYTVNVIDENGKRVQTLSDIRGNCSIGRVGKNMVSLKGWRIAGVHAMLTEKEQGVFVTDKSGGPGTLVNGEQIDTFGPLHAKDEIGIGSYHISVGSEAMHGERSDQGLVEAGRTSDEKEEAASPPVERVAASEEKQEERPATSAGSNRKEQRFFWHNRIHRQLMQAMDLRRTDVEGMNDQELSDTISSLINQIIEKLDRKIPQDLDRERLAREVLHEAIGLGPLEELLADDSITEIMVNHCDDIYIEQHGRLKKTEIAFSSDDTVMSVIERIVSPLGRRIDESSPMVDGRLKDGSRVNAIIPPLAIKGPCLTIRKFSRKKLVADDLVKYGSISPAMVAFLQTAVKNRKNMVISGGTGSGKTTFLNVLSSFIPHSERIVTVEDSAELRLAQPHVVSLEARPANMEGKGAVTIRDLVKNCLRMRPDRIVVGECRGGEALDMLQAMNTGHDGSLTTVHANSPRDLISRLEVMVMMAGMELPERAIREQVTSAVQVIVQQARFSDGSRKVTHIAEITGLESGVVQMQNIFVFKQHGLDQEGRVVGEYLPTGRIPEFYEELRDRGLLVDLGIFSV